jgi:ubiquinone/menaquinone biosynthesis C-methylase UbiE
MGDTYNVGCPIRRDFHDRIMEEADILDAELLTRRLWPGARVLDLGCGPGSFDRQISSRVQPDGTVTGLDTDACTLQRAYTLAAERGCANIYYLRGNAYTQPFRDQAYDVVYCRHLLMHLSEVSRVLHEAMRVTRQGGYIIAREGDFDTWKYYPRYPNWEKLHGIVQLRLGSANIGRQLWSMFHEAGLNNIAMRGIAVVATGDAFCKHLQNWLESFETSGDYLVRSNTVTKDLLSSALQEGEKLLRNPFGLFSCLEYEIEGCKRILDH